MLIYSLIYKYEIWTMSKFKTSFHLWFLIYEKGRVKIVEFQSDFSDSKIREQFLFETKQPSHTDHILIHFAHSWYERSMCRIGSKVQSTHTDCTGVNHEKLSELIVRWHDANIRDKKCPRINAKLRNLSI